LRDLQAILSRPIVSALPVSLDFQALSVSSTENKDLRLAGLSWS
jgi:hypothetical protein